MLHICAGLPNDLGKFLEDEPGGLFVQVEKNPGSPTQIPPSSSVKLRPGHCGPRSSMPQMLLDHQSWRFISGQEVIFVLATRVPRSQSQGVPKIEIVM